MVRLKLPALKLPPLPIDAADRRLLGMLSVGATLITAATLWAAWLVGMAVSIYHALAG